MDRLWHWMALYTSTNDFWRSFFVNGIFWLLDLVLIVMLLPLTLAQIEKRKLTPMREAFVRSLYDYMLAMHAIAIELINPMAYHEALVKIIPLTNGSTAIQFRDVMRSRWQECVEKLQIFNVSLSPELSKQAMQFISFRGYLEYYLNNLAESVEQSVLARRIDENSARKTPFAILDTQTEHEAIQKIRNLLQGLSEVIELMQKTSKDKVRESFRSQLESFRDLISDDNLHLYKRIAKKRDVHDPT